MRGPVRDFCVDVVEHLPITEPVIEIGSRPAAGQEEIANLRQLFPGKEFIGCDVQDGVGVDRIEDVHRLTFADASVGTVVCLDTLEHVADPLRAVREMHRVLKPGGVCAISSVMFFPIHAHPWDFWRFTPEGFALLLDPFNSKLVMSQGFDLLPESVLGVGVKGNLDLNRDLFPRSSATAQNWARGRPVDFGPIRLTLGELWRETLSSTLRAVTGRAGRT